MNIFIQSIVTAHIFLSYIIDFKTTYFKSKPESFLINMLTDILTKIAFNSLQNLKYIMY